MNLSKKPAWATVCVILGVAAFITYMIFVNRWDTTRTIEFGAIIALFWAAVIVIFVGNTKYSSEYIFKSKSTIYYVCALIMLVFTTVLYSTFDADYARVSYLLDRKLYKTAASTWCKAHTRANTASRLELCLWPEDPSLNTKKGIAGKEAMDTYVKILNIELKDIIKNTSIIKKENALRLIQIAENQNYNDAYYTKYKMIIIKECNRNLPCLSKLKRLFQINKSTVGASSSAHQHLEQMINTALPILGAKKKKNKDVFIDLSHKVFSIHEHLTIVWDAFEHPVMVLIDHEGRYTGAMTLLSDSRHQKYWSTTDLDKMLVPLLRTQKVISSLSKTSQIYRKITQGDFPIEIQYSDQTQVYVERAIVGTFPIEAQHIVASWLANHNAAVKHYDGHFEAMLAKKKLQKPRLERAIYLNKDNFLTRYYNQTHTPSGVQPYPLIIPKKLPVLPPPETNNDSDEKPITIYEILGSGDSQDDDTSDKSKPSTFFGGSNQSTRTGSTGNTRSNSGGFRSGKN